MRLSNVILAAAAASSVDAQRPKDTPICDYYTKALLKDNTAKNQATLLTLLVNTVVIGNYTKPNVGVVVPGILAKGKIDGQNVNLAPYFTGALQSSNRGGKAASVNFLDGGAAAPLMKNMPATDKTSNQYFLMTHLYEFFGSLLGCSQQGMSGFDAYSGHASMYEVHKFMDLSKAEVDYFVTQVGLAAASFGVAKDDITAAATAINSLFNVRCAPATTAIKAQGAQLQSICIAADCAQAPQPACDKYAKAEEPKTAAASAMSTATGSKPTATGGSGSGSTMASGTMAATGSATSAAATSAVTAGASAHGMNIAAVLAGVAAFAL